jgi:hypothetical protein
MNPSWPGDDEPEPVKKPLFEKFKERHSILVGKYRRRNRSPLKFVECFDGFRWIMGVMERNAQPDNKAIVAQLKSSYEAMRPEFDRCIPLARAQFEKRQFWDSVYEKGPPVWQGGRADGNS